MHVFWATCFCSLPLHSRDNTVETFCSSLKSSLKTENDGLAHTNITSVVNLLKSCSFEPWRQTKRKNYHRCVFRSEKRFFPSTIPWMNLRLCELLWRIQLRWQPLDHTKWAAQKKAAHWKRSLVAQNIELHARLKKWSHIRKLKIRFRTPFENKWKDCKAEPALAANPGFKWLDCDSYWLVGSCREVSFHSLFLQESAAGPQNIFLASL